MMPAVRLLAHDDGRCRRQRRRQHREFFDVWLATLVALALLAQQTSGVGGELATDADRKSRKRQSSAIVDELAPLSTVEDDPYETDAETYSSNMTSNRRGSANRHQFEFVNPKPGKLSLYSLVLTLTSCNNVSPTTFRCLVKMPPPFVSCIK